MHSGLNCNCETKVTAYSEQYDAYYCESCNEWLEDICTDRDCEFCKNRPIKPLENKNDNA